MKRQSAYVYVLILAAVLLGVFRAASFFSMGREVWTWHPGGEREDSSDVPAARVLLLRDEETETLAEALRWEAAPLPRRLGRIVSFDYSESGKLLVAFAGGRIAVFGEDFQLLASFRFRARKYYVQWYGESIRLVLPYEEAALDFTERGELMRGMELDSWYPQNQDYIRALAAKNVCRTEDGEYRLENGFWRDRFPTEAYDRLVEVRNGKRRVLLEAGNPSAENGRRQAPMLVP